MARYTAINFAVHCETQPGESVFVVGDHTGLGDWDQAEGLQLKTDEKTYPTWSLATPWLVKLPDGLKQSVEVEYRVAVVDKDGKARIEEIEANRRLVMTNGAAGMTTTVAVKHGESEKEHLRIPKFQSSRSTNNSRKFDTKDTPAESEKGLSRPGSSGSLASGMKSVMSGSSVASMMKTVSSGTGLDFRLQAALAEGKDISFWHDIPLFPVTEEGESIPFQCNFVCEIPKTTRKKYEVCTKGVGNPIKQDTKNGKLREYSKGDVWFNYGCLPRTWEDTDFVHPDVGFPGDGDPLDACEIGARMFRTGEVRQTKVLGVICMIDEDETDWKLIVIDVEDRWAPELNSVEDVERLVPGTLDQIREWWRTYKVTDGKPLNKFGLDEKFMPKEYAMEVIVECHEAWRNACEKVETKAPMGGKKLSFSKLEDLDMSTDEAAIKTLAGA